MGSQSSDTEIEHLLAELRSNDPKRQQAAARRIVKLRIQTEEITRALDTVAKTGSDWSTRYAAQDALTSLAKPPAPLSRRGKILLFTVGFVGWYVANAFVWVPLALQPGFTLQGNGIESYGVVGLLTWPANILGLLILAVIPPLRRVALGVLAAMALNFAIALIIGVSIDAYCFIPFFTPHVH